MAEDKFKLPRSSYEELTKIIKTYGHMSEPVNLDTISSTLGMNAANISANSAFLTQIEILEPGQKKQLSPKGRVLSKALDFEMPDEIRRAWRQIVNDSEFLTRVLAAIRIRKGMDEAALASHIAYSAGEPKKGYVLTGARAVTDVLRAAELIIEKDGQLVATKIEDMNDSDHESEITEGQSHSREEKAVVPITTMTPVQSKEGLSFAVNIDISIQCTPENIDQLGDKIRRLLSEIRQEPGLSSTADDE